VGYAVVDAPLLRWRCQTAVTCTEAVRSAAGGEVSSDAGIGRVEQDGHRGAEMASHSDLSQRGEIPLAALDPVVTSARHAFDLVVLDLARASVAERAAATCDVVLLVATGDVRGATSAARTASRLRGEAPLRLVARQVPGGGLDGPALADWLDLPSAADLAHDARLLASLDRGDPPGAGGRLAKVCDQLLAAVLGERAAA